MTRHIFNAENDPHTYTSYILMPSEKKKINFFNQISMVYENHVMYNDIYRSNTCQYYNHF